MICNETERVMAIHRIQDSALCCFQSIINKGEFERFLYLRQIETDDNGLAKKEHTLLTYSKQLPMIIRQVEYHQAD